MASHLETMQSAPETKATIASHDPLESYRSGSHAISNESGEAKNYQQQPNYYLHSQNSYDGYKGQPEPSTENAKSYLDFNKKVYPDEVNTTDKKDSALVQGFKDGLREDLDLNKAARPQPDYYRDKY